MNKRFTKLGTVCTVIAGAIAFLTLSSYSTGNPGNTTAGCSCHGSNSASTILSITGLPTGGWVAGTAYTLTITVTNTTKVAAGFDVGCTAGTFSGNPANTALTNANKEVYHTQPKSMTSGVASWTVTWTAPATGSSVTFNFAGNAVNLNGQDTGDQPNQTSQTVTAAVTTAAPTATTTAATSISATGATLNGSVTANNASTTVSFEYGATTSYGTTAAAAPGTVTGSTATTVTGAASGLVAGTLYHYRVKAVNSAGTTNGADMTFTTATGVTAPNITLNPVTGISNTGATVHATVTANGATTGLTVQYGLTTAYGSNVQTSPASVTGTTATAVSAVLGSLQPNKTYHYRFAGLNSAGTTNTPDATFTTTNLSVAGIAAAGFKMYPNPVQDVLTIDAATAKSTLSILVLDAGGKIVQAQVSRSGSIYTIRVAGLRAGMYWLRLTDDAQHYSAAFVKQ